MKKIFFFLLLGAGLGAGASAHAAYHSFEYAAGLSPTEAVDKSQLEGWIVKVDYTKSTFRLLDPRGFERTVKIKPGSIGDYHRGEHVKVTINPDYRLSPLVEKI